MATVEEYGIGSQTLAILLRTRSNMRANAQSYIDEVNRVPRRLTTQQLGSQVTADAAAFGKNLDLLLAFFNDPTKQTKLVNGTTPLGITGAAMQADWTTLRNAATAQQNADVSTDAAIVAAANATLTNVPSTDVVF